MFMGYNSTLVNNFSILRSRCCTNRHPISSLYSLKSSATVRPRFFHDSALDSIILESHNRAVRELAKDVRKFHQLGQPFRISHGATNSTRSSKDGGTKYVDTSSLSRILHVDPIGMTALVEPNVPMDRLVESTLQHGLVPPVVMEFPGITAGGGYAGTSAESSSFKHGFFDRNVIRIRMVLGDGEIVTCSETENADLFHGAAGALGTLGVTTLLELKLIKAGKFVVAEHVPVKNTDEAVVSVEQATKDETNDYVDGILFSEGSGAIVKGRMTNTLDENLNIQTFSRASDPWYYLYVQERLAAEQQPFTVAIPLADYLFRYDRGGFWVGASAFQYFGMPSTYFTRWFLDDFLHTRMLYKALHASRQSERYIVQDLALPFDTAPAFLRYVHERFGIYPLWLCPLRQSKTPTMHPHNSMSKSGDGSLRPMLNIGLWGEGHLQLGDFLQANQDLEEKLKFFGGMKWLYAQTYYTEARFWEMFDKQSYDALRRKYRADTLPSIYEKVRRAQTSGNREGILDKLVAMRPWSGFYGIWKAIQSKAYMQARTSKWPYHSRTKD